ncbi:adenosine deaminase [Spirosoma sp. SC4-14]|uniref:adenosine deaminase n=1 Tax=Spirosoma sp. SC4-14 TaxID=3128900 RepID=UPI0030CD33FB
MDFTNLPKVELHLHLDCSLSYKVVKHLRPETTLEEYRESFIAPAKCSDLADFITRAIKGIELMQTPDELRLVTLDLFEQLKADHVIYAEIRFAPLQHLEKGLKPEEVVQIVNEAVSEGIQQTGIQAGVILCTLRHYSEAQSMATVQLVKQFSGTNIVGFDIAADEAGFPIDNHKAAFTFASTHGIKCTAHAGEAKGAESVWETLTHFHPLRIGHGVRAAEDPALLAYLNKRRIHLEVCPTSNVQTNVFGSITDHTVDRIYQSGVSMSINTDARTISNVTLAHEYQLLERVFGWGTGHFLHCNQEAIEHSFTTDEIKARLQEKLEAGYATAHL